MLWYLEALSLPIRLNAQQNPVPPLIAAGVIFTLLWFLVAQARRRDARRTARGRDASGWRSRQSRRF
jgi:hypothetical protein